MTLGYQVGFGEYMCRCVTGTISLSDGKEHRLVNINCESCLSTGLRPIPLSELLNK